MSNKNKSKVTNVKEKSVNKPKVKTQTPLLSSPKQESKNRNLSNREPKSEVKVSIKIKTSQKVNDSSEPQIKNISELSESQISDIKGRSNIYKEVNKTTKEHIDLKKNLNYFKKEQNF